MQWRVNLVRAFTIGRSQFLFIELLITLTAQSPNFVAVFFAARVDEVAEVFHCCFPFSQLV